MPVYDYICQDCQVLRVDSHFENPRHRKGEVPEVRKHQCNTGGRGILRNDRQEELTRFVNFIANASTEVLLRPVNAPQRAREQPPVPA